MNQMKIKLKNGCEMPALGLGCYKCSPPQAYDAVRCALDAGYRHIDTAAFYGNEADVGRAVRESGVPREEVFVVNKLWPKDFPRTRAALEDSLKRLNVGYLDAYLLHWPGTDESLRHAAWEGVLNAASRGEVRCPGVSNFLPHHLVSLAGAFGEPPLIDQVELNPLYQQRGVRKACEEFGIAVTSWGPIFRGKIDAVPEIAEIAARYDKTPAQITLRWHLQHGLSAIPKSARRERILENFDVFDFTLSPRDMAALDALDSDRHTGGDPDTFNG